MVLFHQIDSSKKINSQYNLIHFKGVCHIPHDNTLVKNRLHVEGWSHKIKKELMNSYRLETL